MIRLHAEWQSSSQVLEWRCQIWQPGIGPNRQFFFGSVGLRILARGGKSRDQVLEGRNSVLQYDLDLTNIHDGLESGILGKDKLR